MGTDIQPPIEPDGVRYPNSLELMRLEALGTPPYRDVAEARERYEGGRSLQVVPEGTPPAWLLVIAPDQRRFSVTSYAPTSTPLRDVTWERDGDTLMCRRTTDLFYPDGDPGRRVPFSGVVSVRHEIGADGIVRSILSSPTRHDIVIDGAVDVDGFCIELPSFGDWQRVVAPSRPGPSSRFGLDADDSALAAVASYQNAATPAEGGWRIAAGSRGVMGAVDLLVAGGRPVTAVPVIERGVARIIPLAVQAPRSSGRAPREERRRTTAQHDDIRDACEHRHGQAISLDLDTRGASATAAYARGLRGAGATAAEYWVARGGHALVLVTAGDDTAGDLRLSLHLVPEEWVGSGKGLAPAVEDLRWSIADIDADRAGSA